MSKKTVKVQTKVRAGQSGRLNHTARPKKLAVKVAKLAVQTGVRAGRRVGRAVG